MLQSFGRQGNYWQVAVAFAQQMRKEHISPVKTPNAIYVSCASVNMRGRALHKRKYIDAASEIDSYPHGMKL